MSVRKLFVSVNVSGDGFCDPVEDLDLIGRGFRLLIDRPRALARWRSACAQDHDPGVCLSFGELDRMGVFEFGWFDPLGRVQSWENFDKLHALFGEPGRSVASLAEGRCWCTDLPLDDIPWPGDLVGLFDGWVVPPVH